MNCLFCNIEKGNIPSKKIYEDDVVMVIMDINPVSIGHVLIIPKKHFEDFEVLDNDTFTHIFNVAKDIKKVLYDTFKPDGLNLHINYGCNQEIKHFHLHLIPVYKSKKQSLSVNEAYNLITNK